MSLKKIIVDNATNIIIKLINKLPNSCKSRCCESECTNS